MEDNEREAQKQIIREVARELVNGIYQEMGKSVLKALGVLLVFGILALSFKFGLINF